MGDVSRVLEDVDRPESPGPGLHVRVSPRAEGGPWHQYPGEDAEELQAMADADADWPNSPPANLGVHDALMAAVDKLDEMREGLTDALSAYNAAEVEKARVRTRDALQVGNVSAEYASHAANSMVREIARNPDLTE